MYLSKISIKGFRGIESLDANFHGGVNVIIGENASNKSALIDALRLLYCFGDSQRDLWVRDDDFFKDKENEYNQVDKIELIYEFTDLSIQQKGALYEFLVPEKTDQTGQNDIARLTLIYELKPDGRIGLTYFSGSDSEQKPSSQAFELFQHYYLDPLRDSERKLLSSRDNILGKLLARTIKRKDSLPGYENIIKDANRDLLKQDEVKGAKTGINTNVKGIFGKLDHDKVGLRIDSSKVEYILNTIKPYLPHNFIDDDSPGFQLWQNSLGFNNLIYFAVVLGDIRERRKSEPLTHFGLLIEEPEAHLHPQLQLSLYQFLCENINKNTQLFITTHSPTLTSKIPLDDLFLLNKLLIKIGGCYESREQENIYKGTAKLKDKNFSNEQSKIERYLDVTRSQLFFSKGILLVEGISEELLMDSFAHRLGFSLHEYQLELVNVKGTSFYPFLHLFNSSDETKRLHQPVSVITDDDRFPDSKNYSFELIKDILKNDDLIQKISAGNDCTRIRNISTIIDGKEKIYLAKAYKTFEFEIARSNVNPVKDLFYENVLIDYLAETSPESFSFIQSYVDPIFETKDQLDDDERLRVACLVWKALGKKSEFAQDFANFLSMSEKQFIVPRYIRKSFQHLIRNLS